VAVGLADDTDDGRDGKICESLFDPDVFFRVSGGRTSHVALPRLVAGDPARSASGTASTDSSRPGFGEPMYSGDVTPSILALRPRSSYNIDRYGKSDTKSQTECQ
jgi:hypothetical protein